MSDEAGPRSRPQQSNSEQSPPASPAVVVAPPESWLVKIEDSQERWTVRLPGTTVQTRQMRQYQEATGTVPPAGWRGEQFGPYVQVTWRPAGKRVRSTVLKVDLQDTDGTEPLALSPLVFGRQVDGETVTLSPGNRWGHRKARLNTAPGRLRVGALAAGIVSAWITACFGIGRATGHAAFHFSSGAESALLFVAAVFAAASAVTTFVASEMLPTDVPNQK